MTAKDLRELARIEARMDFCPAPAACSGKSFSWDSAL